MKCSLGISNFLEEISSLSHSVVFITLRQIDWGKVEAVTDLVFLGSEIIVDGDCNHEIKRTLLLGRKARANLDSILKSRDITLPTKIHMVKAMVFQ